MPEFDGVGELVDGHEEVLDDPLLSHMHPTHQTLLCDNNSGSSVYDPELGTRPGASGVNFGRIRGKIRPKKR